MSGGHRLCADRSGDPLRVGWVKSLHVRLLGNGAEVTRVKSRNEKWEGEGTLQSIEMPRNVS